MFYPLSPSPRERLSIRTHELAIRAGRTPTQINRRDYLQAKEEVTGETDSERQDALLDAMHVIPPNAHHSGQGQERRGSIPR